MKNTMMRTMAYLLLVCMLLAMLPLSAFAEETLTFTFKFDGWAVDGVTMAIGDGPADGSKSWSLIARSDGTDGNKGINVKNGKNGAGITTTRWKNQDDFSFVAFQLNGITAGTYRMDFGVNAGSSGAAADIYVMPAADLPGTATEIQSKIAGMQSAGKVGCYSKSGTTDPTSISSVAFTDSSNGSYVVVFKAAANSVNAEIKSTTFSLISITLTSSGSSTPAPSTPAATEPAATQPATQPATEPATTPATEPSSGNDSTDSAVSAVYVEGEIAADDCVSSSYFTHAAIGVVNGHDYLYLATRGGKFIVYDVDDKKQVDTEKFNTDTPRYIMVDENGIVWVAGGTDLFRYDPFSGNSEIITLDWSLFDASTKSPLGITSDGNGKIYFGTLNNGYIGCYDTATKKTTRISDWLGTEGHEQDTKQSAYAGMIYKDGYLYLGIDGDQNADGDFVHAIIKYDIANRKIVDSLDISECYAGRQYLDFVSLVGDVAMFSFMGQPNKPVYIDISGSKMKFVEFPDLAGHTSAITEELNGKRYFGGYYGDEETKGIVEFDVATKQSKLLLEGNYAFRLKSNNFVTIEGDDRLPGKSVLIPVNDEVAGLINLTFWNPQTNEYVTYEANIGQTGGAGSNLKAMVLDPTGRYIYVGAYGNTGVSKYDTVTGTIVDSFNTFSHQTDGLHYYDGYLYAGNYSAGCITQINPETNEVSPLFSLRYSVFEQCRMPNLAAGGNKVFCATVPYSGFGGVLVWYDLNKNLTYVAAGPNPEDVYYADTSGLTVDSNVQALKYTWYNAVSGEAMDFDDDDDGKDDVYLADGTRRFRGLITDQTLNNIYYKDGYIYGTTSINGASGTFPSETVQAVLFVYDVAAMKVIATCDLATKLEGFTNQIPIIDQLAEDPEKPGKFWGVIDDTLFTMTFDLETKAFDVKEELSIKKEQYYSLPGSAWRHRDICFDGEYIYVGFGRNTGTYMVRKIDPQEHYLINKKSYNAMVLAADGNLYWLTNESEGAPKALNMFRIAELTAPLKEKAPVDTAQRLINALPDKITANDKSAIEAARKAYNKLSDDEKAQITNVNKLIAAEEAFANLPDTNVTVIICIVAAVIVLAGGAVAVVLVLKKKKKNSAE